MGKKLIIFLELKEHMWYLVFMIMLHIVSEFVLGSSQVTIVI